MPVLSQGRDLRSLLSQEEESGGRDLWEESSRVPAVGPVGAYQEQDIVQCSASEQTHWSPVFGTVSRCEPVNIRTLGATELQS